MRSQLKFLASLPCPTSGEGLCHTYYLRPMRTPTVYRMFFYLTHSTAQSVVLWQGPGWESYITWHSRINFIFLATCTFPESIFGRFLNKAKDNLSLHLAKMDSGSVHVCTNNNYHPYINYFGENDKRICMGQIRHIIAQGLFCRGIILGVEPAEMGPLSNMRKVNQTSVYLKTPQVVNEQSLIDPLAWKGKNPQKTLPQAADDLFTVFMLFFIHNWLCSL